LGFDTKHLSENAINTLNTAYRKLYNKYSGENVNYDNLNTELASFEKLLRSNDIYVPYLSVSNYIEDIPSLSKEDKETLLNKIYVLEPAYPGQENTESDNIESDIESNNENSYDEDYDALKILLLKYNINIDELISQFQNSNFNIAIYNVEKDNFRLNSNSPNKNILNDSEKNKLASINEQIKKIIPKSIWNMISSIEYNTDGKDNVMAHTVPDTEDTNDDKFRLAIDTNDIVDSNGKLTLDGKETIVHETGHMLTLKSDQVNPVSWDGDGSESSEEKFKKDSYLMNFYNKFWFDIIDDYNKTDNKIEFYNNYKDEFVSDYAATNIEEDIAESFRIFVCGEKPTTLSVADKKVLFFYDYPELVKIRNEYRNNL